jgi:hypothetical protein
MLNKTEAIKLFESVPSEDWQRHSQYKGVEARFGDDNEFIIELFRFGYLKANPSERGHNHILNLTYNPQDTSIYTPIFRIVDDEADDLMEQQVPEILEQILAKEQAEAKLQQEQLEQHMQNVEHFMRTAKDPKALRNLLEQYL